MKKSSYTINPLTGLRDVADDIQQCVQAIYLFELRSFCHVAVGAAFGTAKSGIGIAGVGTFKPELIMKASPQPSFLRSLLRTIVLYLVSGTGRHVWYHSSLWIGSVGAHRGLTFVFLKSSIVKV